MDIIGNCTKDKNKAQMQQYIFKYAMAKCIWPLNNKQPQLFCLFINFFFLINARWCTLIISRSFIIFLNCCWFLFCYLFILRYLNKIIFEINIKQVKGKHIIATHRKTHSFFSVWVIFLEPSYARSQNLMILMENKTSRSCGLAKKTRIFISCKWLCYKLCP